MGELLFRVRDFFSYTPKEKRDVMLAIAVVTLAFAYNDGSEFFELSKWTANLFLTLIMVSLTIFVHTAAQKVFALQNGFLAEFRAWPIGLLVTFALTILSAGHLIVLLPGGLMLFHSTTFRLGKWRYGENVTARGMIAASGAVANLVLATFSLAMSAQLGFMPAFFGALATINFWYMIYSLLPIPRLDGIHLFFFSRLTYVFIVSTLLAYVLLTTVGVYSWIFSFIIGVICWFMFYIYVEEG